MKIEVSLSAPMFKLGLRNKIQCALYEEELKGQMSDGYWENSTPRDHWKVPCNAKAFVATTPTQLGPDFYPERAYNFASPKLLEYVGDRMLAIGLKLDKTYNMAKLAKDLTDLSKIFNSKRSGKGVPDAPTPVGVRASPIKGNDKYTWYDYNGSTPVTLNRRGMAKQVKAGTLFGIRPSSNGKEVRLIFQGAETLVYTLTPDQQTALLKSSKSA